MKEQFKALEKIQLRDSQLIRCTVQNTGFQDASGTHWVPQQHKKRPRQR